MKDIQDCFGNNLFVGSFVAFGEAGRGAKEFLKGKVTRVLPKSVEIEDEEGCLHMRLHGAVAVDPFNELRKNPPTFFDINFQTITGGKTV